MTTKKTAIVEVLDAEHPKKVSTIKYRVDHSDGTWSETTFYVPYFVEQHIQCKLIDWRNEYQMTMNDAMEYDALMKSLDKPVI